MKRISFALMLGTLGVLYPVCPVWGHGLLAKARVEVDTVTVHAKYDDGTIARLAKVVVHNEAHYTIAEGETNAQGEWTFALPEPGTYTITVNAGAGHLKTFALTIGDPGQQQSQPAPQPQAGDSDGDSSRWLKIGIGVGVIGLLGLAMLAARRLRRAP